MCRNRCVKHSNEPDITVAPLPICELWLCRAKKARKGLGVLGEEASTIPRCCWPRRARSSLQSRLASSPSAHPGRPRPVQARGRGVARAPSPASLTGTALPRRLPRLLTREAGTYEWTPASRREAEGGDVPQSCAPDRSAAVLPAARA